MTALALVHHKGEARVDTRLLAQQLGLQHQHVYEMVKQYASDFELLGILRFETGEIRGRGQPAKFALLNEDQAYLLLTFSRNTHKVRDLKVRLVLAFKEARAGAAVHALEYLPGYHALHERAHQLAKDSPNERFVHMNLNKLVNKAVGVEAGSRAALPPFVKSRVIVAQDLACRAMEAANDHHDGYKRAKEALGALGRVLQIR